MWIRSQDDRLLIDADKIYVGGTDKCQIYNIGESFNCFLGNYSSLEKAIRVLDEIENQLNEFDLEGTVVYQMPADDDVKFDYIKACELEEKRDDSNEEDF